MTSTGPRWSARCAARTSIWPPPCASCRRSQRKRQRARSGRYFQAAAPLAAAPVADAEAEAIDPVDAEDIEIEGAEEDTGAEVATVEAILEDEDDPVDAIVDVVPEDEGRPDE